MATLAMVASRRVPSIARVGLIALALSDAPLAIAQAAVERPQWKAGDEWVFDVVNERTGERSTGSRKILAVRPDGGYTVVDQGAKPHKTDANMQDERRNHPELKGKWWRWPLTVGEKWEFELPLVIQAGNGTQTVRRHVTGIETISVPAGKFECLRIESTRTRYTYDARKMSRPNDSSVIDYVTWYCPAIRYVGQEEQTVRDGYGHTERSVSLLTSYQLAP